MGLWLYLKALWKHWWTLLSCAVFTVVTLIQALGNRSSTWMVWATGICASALLLVAAFLTWKDEYRRAEAEKAKNEAAPHVNIAVLNVVPHGRLGSGLTDLFINLDLVLESPSQVSILDFSLMVFDSSQSSSFPAAEDVLGWELTKRNGEGRSSVRCVPLVKELPRRGDPVQSWVHFPLPNVTERDMQVSGVRIELNCVHGTCYYNLDGAYIHSDPNVKGVMRKIPAS